MVDKAMFFFLRMPDYGLCACMGFSLTNAAIRDTVKSNRHARRRCGAQHESSVLEGAISDDL